MTAPVQQKTPPTSQSLITRMADQYGLEPTKFLNVLASTVVPKGTPEQVAAFLVVANQYQLNPFTREIYAFPDSRTNGIIPIVSVNGWLAVINRQPALDGIEFTDHIGNDGKLTAITCRIYRKDRKYPVEVTEYMEECFRNTDPWKKYPSRMLRHKVLIQGARYAFGLVGIYDTDEAERIAEGEQAAEIAPMAERTKDRMDAIKQRYATPKEMPDEEFELPEGGLAAQAVDEVEAEIVTDEDEHEHLQSIAQQAYKLLKGEAKKAANEFLGQRLVKDLTTDELSDFLGMLQGDEEEVPE